MKNKSIIFFYLLTAIIFFAEGCKVEENIQDGQTAFKLKKYSLAAELLQKDFNKAETPDEKGTIAFEIAQSYEFNNNYENAATWYNKAADLNYGSEAILQYAYMLKAQEKYDEAAKQFNNYLNEEPYRRNEIAMQTQSCTDALTWMAQQANEYERDTYVSNVKELNSADADFNPVLFQNTKLIFTSSRSESTGAQDKWTGDKYYDMYESDMNGFNSFSQPTLFAAPFNSEFNDGTASFSNDGTEIFFTRCGSTDKKIDDYCAIYESSYVPDGGWSEPVELSFFEDTMNLGTPCLSPDEQTLFFSATNPDGFGGSDIYMAKRNDAGWDAAVNIGQVINTDGNEVFPYFDKEGVFYFSSDKHPGMGGLDIFSATWKNNKFSNVRNLEYPINSGADDFGLLMMKIKSKDTLQLGYFSSNRKGGEGGDDIYMFVKTKKKLRPPVFVLNGKLLRKIYSDSTDVNSSVIDSVSLTGSVAISNITDLITPIAKFNVSTQGEFSMQIDSVMEYKITGMKDGYFNNSTFASAKNIKAKPGDTVKIYAEIVLDKIPVATADKGGEIKLKNIYYDFNDTTLRAESFPELDKLIKLLNENPGISIQINSHTDSRGTDKYNNKLSRGRANSVVAYLIKKGIDQTRLSAKGFGESSPGKLSGEEILPSGKKVEAGTILTEAFINTFKSNTDDFEFLHQLNRRTTFNVTSATININSEDNTPEIKGPEKKDF